MRPSSHFRLFGHQQAAFESGVRELLVGGDESPCGASHLLRVLAIWMAGAHRGIRVLLLQRNSAELQRDHLDGPSGMLRMLADMEAHGAVRRSLLEARFATGSTISWSGCGTDAESRRLLEQHFDVLLVDGVDLIPEPFYRRMRDRVLASAHDARRIVATTNRRSAAGWVRSHWNGAGDPDRDFAELPAAELDPEVAVVERPPSYREFLERLHGGRLVFPPHVDLVVGDIDRWIRGEWDHYAVFMPSQHGKTEAGPRNAPAYILTLWPSDWCAITSYDAGTANSRSADARDNFVDAGGHLKPGRRKANEWKTLAGGGCWSGGSGKGVGGSASWLFGDDWDKDWADAVSATQQRKKRRWIGSTLRSRETIFSADRRIQKICLTATRWDPGDSVGYALKMGHDTGERWAIRALPAVYDPRVVDGYRELYPRFEILPDFREVPGEPIWPERRDSTAWEAVRIQRGPLIFDTECQQRPRGAESGGLFKADWFGRLNRDPAFAGKTTNEQVYGSSERAWDLAATEGAGDYTAGAKLGRLTDGGQVVVRHVVRGQLSPGRVRQLIAGVAILDGYSVKVRIPDDPAAGGKAAADAIVRYVTTVFGRLDMRPPRMRVEKPRKGRTATMSAKAARARDLQSLAEPPGEGIDGGVSYVAATWAPALSDVIPNYAERVAGWPELAAIADVLRLVAGEWWTPWLQEMEAFTGEDGRQDDQVDATVDAAEDVAPPRSRIQVF